MGKAKRKSSHSTPKSIAPLLAPLQAIQTLLLKFNNQGVIIGGVAASLLGTPRFTVDLDAVILLSLEDIPKFLDEAARQGVEPRIPDALMFARKNRVLLMRHIASGMDMDISLGVLPFEIEMVERSHTIEISGIQLRLPTPEDLIIMKAVAHRTKDLDDILAIANSHPELDRDRVRYWVEQFAGALDLPNLWDEIAKYLP
ncbi:MAG TPA: nucleotidyl transferase AbiEii/AbiGii toxin family protein [Anaerolineales bacterium]|nr:nucleotidyl transferase AbiEii/AbiGii toxin family protein [Anaerolineales bacterium]